MHGHLFSLLDTPFPSYFVLMLVGFLMATTMGALWAKRVGQNPDVIVDLGLAMVICGVAGARLLHVFADGYFWDYVHLCTDPARVDWAISRAECLAPLADAGCGLDAGGPVVRGIWDEARKLCHPPARDCLAWAKFWAGGLTFYGGFIGAVLGAYWLFKRDKFPFWKGVDMGGMMVPIGLGFGRVGCLLAGCCFGETSAGPWALSFPGFSPASEAQAKAGLLAQKHLPSLPVHPTQIYEAAAAFAISAFVILFLHERKRYDGQVFVAFLALYGLLRFVIEFWRADERGGLWQLSTSQLIAVGMLGLAFAIHRYRRGTALPRAALVSASALNASQQP